MKGPPPSHMACKLLSEGYLDRQCSKHCLSRCWSFVWKLIQGTIDNEKIINNASNISSIIVIVLLYDQKNHLKHSQNVKFPSFEQTFLILKMYIASPNISNFKPIGILKKELIMGSICIFIHCNNIVTKLRSTALCCLTVCIGYFINFFIHQFVLSFWMAISLLWEALDAGSQEWPFVWLHVLNSWLFRTFAPSRWIIA